MGNIYNQVPCKECGKLTVHFTDLCMHCRRAKNIKMKLVLGPESIQGRGRKKNGKRPKDDETIQA